VRSGTLQPYSSTGNRLTNPETHWRKSNPPHPGRTAASRVREDWSIEAHHHVRDVGFGEDAAASRTSRGPVNLATIRAAMIAALKDVGYLHIPEGRRDHTTPAETLRLHGLD
jgi:hypothetical protein